MKGGFWCFGFAAAAFLLGVGSLVRRARRLLVGAGGSVSSSEPV